MGIPPAAIRERRKGADAMKLKDAIARHDALCQCRDKWQQSNALARRVYAAVSRVTGFDHDPILFRVGRKLYSVSHQDASLFPCTAEADVDATLEVMESH